MHKDAIAIIHSDQRGGSVDYLNRVAELAQEELAKLESRLISDPTNRDGIIYDIRQKHQEARRHRDNVTLTATTLVLIHQRAKELGQPGEAAIREIEVFFAKPYLQEQQ